MKLKECLEIGKTCGLTTLEECYDNVYLHAGSLFKYDEIGKEILELQQDMFACDPDRFCQIFKATKEELIAKGWIVNKKQSYKESEEELKVEYENFLKIKEGQEWKEHWIKKYSNPNDIKDAGDFGDYLYDFYTEMLQ